MAIIGPNNALAWAHFQLRGGWKRSAAFTLGAGALLLILIITNVRTDPARATRTLYGWTSGLLMLQAACLVLYVPGRISGAVRQDMTTRMMESHRLMPVPATHAVAGYLAGAAMQPLIFSAALFLLGAYTSLGAGLRATHWAMINGILLAFALFVWALSAYASFAARLGPALLFMPLFVTPYATDGGGIALVPGMMVVLSPLIGQSVFDLRASGAPLPATYAMGLAAQGYFGAIFFAAAARRYRSPEGIGLSPLLGLLLVAGWSAVSAVALREWEDFRPGRWRNADIDVQAQWASSMIVGLVLGLAPVAASAWEAARWRRHQRLGDPAPLRRPAPPALVVIAATLLVPLVLLVGPEGYARAGWERAAHSALIIGAALGSMYFLYAWVYAAYPSAGIIAFVWLLIAWGGPIVVDLIRFGLADDRDVEPIAGFATCSPIGALTALWGGYAVNPRPGFAMQLLIGAVPLALYATQRARTRDASA